MRRSKENQNFIDTFAKKSFGRTEKEAREKGICVCCGNPIDVENFRNILSREEYEISGLCQKCQDDTFGV